jgi:multidrug efflux pump subunit AcrB
MSRAPHPQPFRVAEMSRVAIRGWRVVSFTCVALALLALLAWHVLPRLEDPEVDLQEAGVVIPYPGASPEDVDRDVVRIVQDELYSLDKLVYVESSAVPNAAVFHLKFEDDTPMDVMLERIRGRIEAKRSDLPSVVEAPSVRQYGNAWIVQSVIAVTGGRSLGVLTDAAKRVKDRIADLPGVEDVVLRGDEHRALRVRMDSAKLRDHGLSVDAVVAQLRRANVRIAAGEVAVADVDAPIRIDTEATDTATLAATPVGAASDGHGGTRAILLGDVADVAMDAMTPKERFVFDGAPAVGIEVRFRRTANAVKVGEALRERLRASTTDLPRGVEARIAYDQPAWVTASLDSFLESLAEGIGLVLLVVTLGMRWRPAVVVALVLPLAVGGAVAGLYLTGFALERVSIAGLIVALGLLVDDAVVVTESIQLLRDRGLGAVRAAVLGTARVFGANNVTTLVACASFLPLFFLGGKVGTFIRGLPTSVVLALVTSLALAQLFTPWVATLILRPKRGAPIVPDDAPFDRHDDGAERGEAERNPVLRGLKAAYAWMAPWIVRNPWKVIVLAAMALVASIGALPRVGFQFFGKADKPLVFVTIDLPSGAAQATTIEKVAEVLRTIGKDPDVVETSGMVGASYSRVFISRGPRTASPSFAELLVRTSPVASTAAVASRLRRELADVPGIRANVEELYNGPPVPHPITIRILGDDADHLREQADQVEALLRAQPGTVNVADNLTASIPIAHVSIDRARALRVGITAAQVGETLRSLYGDDRIARSHRSDETLDVSIDRGRDASPFERLEDVRFPRAGGGAVPLHAFGEVTLARDFAELKRRNTRPLVEITADVDGGVLPSRVLKAVLPTLKAKAWPPGYSFSIGGEQAETEESFRTLGVATAGTMLIILLALLVTFESVTLAGVVLFAVPFAVIGAVPALLVTHYPFSFMAFLGLIALIGVYVNHKIYFVDRALSLVARGARWEEALVQAGIDRMRPVVLTALTAILGLLPLTLGGGSLWAPFGWVNVFGLAASIPLSLLLLPALVAVAVRRKVKRQAPVEVEEPAPESVEDDSPTQAWKAAPTG